MFNSYGYENICRARNTANAIHTFQSTPEPYLFMDPENLMLDIIKKQIAQTSSFSDCCYSVHKGAIVRLIMHSSTSIRLDFAHVKTRCILLSNQPKSSSVVEKIIAHLTGMKILFSCKPTDTASDDENLANYRLLTHEIALYTDVPLDTAMASSLHVINDSKF